ncbi:MAG: glycoside hydrolase family 9 protein [Bacteroidota bacterium]|nr:glycoside hydrolase family 9 protein [Bacteroidota bacterium]
MNISCQWVMFAVLSVCCLMSCHDPSRAQSGVSFRSSVLVDQAGYRPDAAKFAFVKDPHGNTFKAIDVRTNKTALRGEIAHVGMIDGNTGDTTFTIDFSALKAPGEYCIVLQDTAQRSEKFLIGDNVYTKAAKVSLQSFYYERCGVAVNNGTQWNHPACHTAPAHYFNDPAKTKDVSGGWHDAGDYNKFVPTTAVSAAFLLYLYEAYPGKFNDGDLNIPESHNGLPDLLDEARWGLAWLLKMQREDGGVYHKVSIKNWTGEHLPQKESDTQYIFDVSSTSTGDFAAVTALGARIFSRWDKAFAQTLLRASLKAWDFLRKNPAIVPAGGFRNPPGVEGGEYGDEQDADERLWAAAELYRTTGNPEYDHYFLSHYKDLGGANYTVGWQHVQNFAYYSYLMLPVDLHNYEAHSFIVGTMTHYCDVLLKRIQENGYRCVLMPDEYYWGSNSVIMGYAFDLINAYETTKLKRYLDGALDQLHYILGRNTFDISFVTGVGSNPVMHPYHQFSMLSGVHAPVPGMLVAGCNKYSRLRGRLLSEYPGRCYEDNAKNYFVNEPAINYTAPFAFVAGYCALTTGNDTANH